MDGIELWSLKKLKVVGLRLKVSSS